MTNLEETTIEAIKTQRGAETIGDALRRVIEEQRAVALPACTNPGACFCEGRTYRCGECARDVPWCFGADDDHPELCDDCAALRIAAELEAEASS